MFRCQDMENGPPVEQDSNARCVQLGLDVRWDWPGQHSRGVPCVAGFTRDQCCHNLSQAQIPLCRLPRNFSVRGSFGEVGVVEFGHHSPRHAEISVGIDI